MGKKLRGLSSFNKEYLLSRVNYYNKLDSIQELNPDAVLLKSIKKPQNPKAYHFDSYAITKYYDSNFLINPLFGDITEVSSNPSIQKSRPITDDNKNAIILKLDKKRHFLFVKDPFLFTEKKNMLIGRLGVTLPHRIRFMEKHFENPLCDIGQVNLNGGNKDWIKPVMPIFEHLKYKFILSLEGNDVATNLKWIMSSNSIAVMPKPKYETWFMEGKLIPDYHYIQVKDDYSDLNEKLNYYIQNTEASLKIVEQANTYVNQFKNKKLEKLISLLVLEKYFYCTGQLNRTSL